MDAKANNFGPAGSGFPTAYRGLVASGQPNAREAASALASISGWQAEHETKLQRLCERIRARVDDGQPLLKAVRREARRYQGRPFRTDPARRWALSWPTLLRWWYCWRLSGELPCAFRLRFAARKTTLPLPVVTRFIGFCSDNQFHSQRAAWLAFAKVEAKRWRHWRSGRPSRGYRFSAARRFFTGTDFRKLQAELKAIAHHQKERGRLRILFCADAQRRFPAPAARHRRNRWNYSI
jgi:hypothetical protein